MEIYEKENEFKPVHIILETQKEVDMLFSIMNFTPITEAFDSHSEKTSGMLHGLHYELNYYKSSEYENFHRLLNSHIGRI